MKRWIGLTIGLVTVALVVYQWPEIERYRRIRAM